MQTAYQPHLYMICYPNSALVLSHLSPQHFGAKYNYGSATYYTGKLVFAEIDINYRHPYFRIDEALKGLKPHADGNPKATKYISSYRVLEHVDIDAIQVLYLANADGTSFPLEEKPYKPVRSDNILRVYAEIDPVRVMTLSRLSMREFGEWFTDPNNIIAVPRLLYTQVTLDIPAFLRRSRQS